MADLGITIVPQVLDVLIEAPFIGISTSGPAGAAGSSVVTAVTQSNGLTLSGGTLALSSASATTAGGLSAADWITFNSKQSALGFTPVPDSRTVNGKSLSSNIALDASDVGAVAVGGAGSVLKVIDYTVPSQTALSNCSADAVTDVVTITGSAPANGTPLRAYAGTGVLPTGISAYASDYVGPIYWVVSSSGSTFKLSSSKGGAALNIGDNGTSGWYLQQADYEAITISTVIGGGNLAVAPNEVLDVEFLADKGVGYSSANLTHSLLMTINGDRTTRYRYVTSTVIRTATTGFGGASPAHCYAGNVLTVYNMRLAPKTNGIDASCNALYQYGTAATDPSGGGGVMQWSVGYVPIYSPIVSITFDAGALTPSSPGLIKAGTIISGRLTK